ncbi:hypothetical protein [Romboutsia sp.]|uniref:hypothetical protein n=1 Tax=Romboutsia sp. TaxID=1965302 RepID=UPI003F3AB6E0
MRFFQDNSYRKKIAIVISIPILLVAQYYLFKFGILKPMVKGVEIQMVDGDYIKDLDKFVIKLNDTIILSSGEYVTIPTYSKKPKIWFKELDDNGILKIEGDKVIALKEGTSSVGIMKNTRVLKKVNIKVVQPRVKSLAVNVSRDIKYVGDTARVEATVEVDYDRFKEKEPIVYISSNEEILKVENNVIKAVGVGKATIHAKSGDKEQLVVSSTIQTKISRIDIASVIEVGVDKSKKLQPTIITSPKGLKPGNIKYELASRKLPIERCIRLDKDGNIFGLKEGEEKVKISCGNKSKIITIKVIKEPITNNKIENLVVDYEVVNNKILIKLSWDYIKGVYDYEIYLKNNSEENLDFKLFKNIKIKEEDVLDNIVSATVELDLINGDIPSVSLYVVGKTPTGNTGQSTIVNIKPEKQDIENQKVENLYSEINDDSIKLKWNAINIPNVTYSIYIKDNIKEDSGFILYQNAVEGNELTIPTNEEDVNFDVYVVANQNNIYSKPSNIINVKR